MERAKELLLEADDDEVAAVDVDTALEEAAVAVLPAVTVIVTVVGTQESDPSSEPELAVAVEEDATAVEVAEEVTDATLLEPEASLEELEPELEPEFEPELEPTELMLL